MNARRITFLSLAAALGLAWLATEVKAQDSYAEYNRQRAQRLFLTSRSPYRTYSGYTPGYVRDYATPTGYVREWQSPAYRHERITPRGYERYDGVAERGYSVAPRPVVLVPRYTYPTLPYDSPLLRTPRITDDYPRPVPRTPRNEDDYYPPVP